MSVGGGFISDADGAAACCSRPRWGLWLGFGEQVHEGLDHAHPEFVVASTRTHGTWPAAGVRAVCSECY
jgi:hypothetical protein